MCRYYFVTGGSGAIGSSLVKSLLRSGHKVAFTYNKNEAVAKELSKEEVCLPLKWSMGEALLENTENRQIREGTVDKQAQSLIDSACTYFGIKSFDGFVATAGVSYRGLFQEADFHQWEEIFKVNVISNALLARKLIGRMISAEKAGSIIFTSSIWGGKGGSMESLYSASKGAIESLTKALAKELGPSGIRVNAVAPGFINSNMNSWMREEEKDMIKERIPLGYIGSASEVTSIMQFLLSEKSSYITGQIIGVDGGGFE